MNCKPSERAALLAAIDPDVTTASTVNSGWVDASKFHTLMAVVMAGTLGTSATVDAKLEQATSAAGAGAKDISGAAITQLTEAGTDSDKQALINLRTDELDVDGGFSFVRLSITVGTATSDAAGLLWGFDPRFGPASDFDAATVAEIAN